MISAIGHVNNNPKTLAVRTLHPQRAFTLIEIALALLILSLILAAAIPSMSSYFVELRLRNTLHQLESSVQKARHLAMTTQKNHRIQFNDRGLEIYDATVSEKQKNDPLHTEVWSSGIQVREKIPETPPRYTLPEDWHLTSSGLCAPLTFRITYQEAWMECTFHPLVGQIQNLEFRLP